jgi:beta,beta-carotene 9',10'-dioxygenase
LIHHRLSLQKRRKIYRNMKKFLRLISFGFIGLHGACVLASSSEEQALSGSGDEMSPLYFFQNCEESDHLPLKVTGKIPEWLRGEFIRNGPGLVKDKTGYVKSWFDGLAKLYAFTIKDGRVTFTAKFLDSEAYKKFQASGLFDFFGFAEQPKENTFSFLDFLFGCKNRDITNANVNVAKINNCLVALTEIPLPVVFDESLNTLGFFDYDDNLPKNYSFESAHVLEDPDTQATWNFLIKIGLFGAAYQIYYIPSQSSERKLVASIPVSSISYMHSFSLAGAYVVLVDYPLRASNPKDLVNGFIESFAWDDQGGSVVYVIEKKTGKYWTLKTQPFFSFHHVNGFEKDGKICVDLIAYPTARIIQDVNYYPFIRDPDNSVLRLEIDLATEQVRVGQLSQEHIEFPRLNEELIGKQAQYFYAVHIQKKGNGILKYKEATFQHASWFESGVYANEPVFVPHPQARAEDDGVILSVINNLREKKSYLLILDARNLSELARVEAPHPIPFGFHGKFFRE